MNWKMKKGIGIFITIMPVCLIVDSSLNFKRGCRNQLVAGLRGLPARPVYKIHYIEAILQVPILTPDLVRKQHLALVCRMLNRTSSEWLLAISYSTNDEVARPPEIFLELNLDN
jgi:hypothetical protein